MFVERSSRSGPRCGARADMDDRSIDLVKEWEHHLCHACQCRVSFLHYPHHVVPPHSVDDLRSLPRENRIDTYLNFGMEFSPSL